MGNPANNLFEKTANDATLSAAEKIARVRSAKNNVRPAAKNHNLFAGVTVRAPVFGTGAELEPIAKSFTSTKEISVDIILDTVLVGVALSCIRFVEIYHHQLFGEDSKLVFGLGAHDLIRVSDFAALGQLLVYVVVKLGILLRGKLKAQLSED